MADNQAGDEIVDDGVTQGRVSPSLPVSNRSRNRQTQRENRAKNRGSRGRSGHHVLFDAQRDLANARARTSRRAVSSRSPLPASQHSRTSIPVSTTTSAPSTSHREHTHHSGSPLPASQQSRSFIPASRSDTDAEVDDRSSDENEIPVQTSTPRGRKKSSMVWNHCYQTDKITYCNYCPSNFVLNGSTSTALYHIRHHHHDKLSEAEKLQLQTGGLTSPDASLPKRSTNRRLTDESPDISHYSLKGRTLDRKLARALVTGAVSINFLDNVQFAIFCESLCPRYKLPSRAYMTNTIIPSLYDESLDIIKDILNPLRAS